MAEVYRRIEYDDQGDPVLVIHKKVSPVKTFRLDRPVAPSFAIRLNDVWQYSEDHNPRFIYHMSQICQFLCNLFDLGLVTPSRMGRIASVIEEGIDDLIKAPPQKEELVNLGEVKVTMADLRGEGSVSHVQDLVVSKPLSEVIH
ncbi:MAG: hypothetical protein HGJ94_18355 [Desulfosarcina sp.]|nr:hypothetical protein [Desulfosarcina sp.]